MEARIPDVLKKFDFRRAAGVVTIVEDRVLYAQELCDQAKDILHHIAEMPNRTLVRGQNLTGLRLGSELILVLNCMCSYQTPKQAPDEPR